MPPFSSAARDHDPRLEGTPVRSSLELSSLRAGDVVIFGVFERECDERLCSDVVSLLNGLGAALMPDRYAGVHTAWACHAAIYAGAGMLVHATGPDTTFVLAVEQLEPYARAHPRLATVFRFDDAQIAEDAAALALSLANASHARRRYSVSALLLQLGLQAVFPGRCDAVIEARVSDATRTGSNPFDGARGLLSCSALVSAVLHLAARRRGVELGFSSDVSPFDLLVAMLEAPAWRLVAIARPEALRATPLPRLEGARSIRPRSIAALALPFAASMIAGCVVALLFAAGAGRSLHRFVFDRPAPTPDPLRIVGLSPTAALEARSL